jgi:hypothetical protein
MTPVFQSIIDPEDGDCFAAALASILDLPLEEVPKEQGWTFVLIEWLQARHDLHDGQALRAFGISRPGERRRAGSGRLHQVHRVRGSPAYHQTPYLLESPLSAPHILDLDEVKKFISTNEVLIAASLTADGLFRKKLVQIDLGYEVTHRDISTTIESVSYGGPSIKNAVATYNRLS